MKETTPSVTAVFFKNIAKLILVLILFCFSLVLFVLSLGAFVVMGIPALIMWGISRLLLRYFLPGGPPASAEKPA